MINNVVLVGRITKDPELKQVGEDSVVNFTIAVNRPYTNDAGERQADFIQCVVWRKQAENLAQYIHKGDMIGVMGSIQTRQWTGDDDVTHYVTEVNANSIAFLGTKSSDSDHDTVESVEAEIKAFKAQAAIAYKEAKESDKAKVKSANKKHLDVLEGKLAAIKRLAAGDDSPF